MLGHIGEVPHDGGQPAVEDLQREGQVGALPVIDAAPLGGEVSQFPQRLWMAVPAVGKGKDAALAVVRDQDLGDPVLETGQLARPIGGVEVVPPRGCGTFRRGCVEGFSDGGGELFESVGQFSELHGKLVYASMVEPMGGGIELAAEIGHLLRERAK